MQSVTDKVSYRYLMNEKGGITAVQKQLAHRNIAYSAVYAQRTDDELERILDGH